MLNGKFVIGSKLLKIAERIAIKKFYNENLGHSENAVLSRELLPVIKASLKVVSVSYVTPLYITVSKFMQL